MSNFWRNNRSYFLAMSLLLVVRGTFADQNRVPSGSMEPTIQVGDHILVNRMAYDLKLPFTETTLVTLNEPQRGDVIVFHNPQTDVRMVKRLIGVPGDHLHVHNGIVFINGESIPGSDQTLRQLAASDTDEFLYQEYVGTHVATIKRTRSLFRHDDVDIVIPVGQYFAMGDNRDNSYDSRAWGLVPRAKIVGRAEGVLFNVNFRPLPKVQLARTAQRFS